jgi:Flp pilus assembly CpaF family ATPase
MTTAHANSPEDMLRRVETMVRMAGMELPLRAVREQIASALTLVVQQVRRKTGRRLVTEIAWIAGLDKVTHEYIVKPLFSRDRSDNVTTHAANLEALWNAEELSKGPSEVLGPLGRKRA